MVRPMGKVAEWLRQGALVVWEDVSPASEYRVRQNPGTCSVPTGELTIALRAFTDDFGVVARFKGRFVYDLRATFDRNFPEHSGGDRLGAHYHGQTALGDIP